MSLDNVLVKLVNFEVASFGIQQVRDLSGFAKELLIKCLAEIGEELNPKGLNGFLEARTKV